MWEKELDMAKKLAVEAGKEIMKIYASDRFDVTYKQDSSPLTDADRISNEIIVDGLSKAFPEYAILSEEMKDTKERLDNDYCFVIDPLDGTKEFLKRNGQFTVNIALAYKHVSVMGVIYAPAIDELYYASKGTGVFYKTSHNCLPIHVSQNLDRSNLKAVMSSSHGCKEMDDLIEKYHIRDFVKMGSSLKGCLVAKGEADIYYRHNPTMEWDTAAMQCIAEEAGGIFRQMDGTDMLYNRENSLNEKGFFIVNHERNILI